ncbi:MAG: hypothetical protein CMJ18_19080 [Phycisphaeraceae bacterium]|nr:hypothetical protein [Phycisphaeraceae bacterium]
MSLRIRFETALHGAARLSAMLLILAGAPGVAAERAVSEINVAPPQRSPSLVDRQAARFAPGSDQWSTEKLSQLASDQLKKLTARFEQPGKLDRNALAPLLTDSFQCSTLRPEALRQVRADATITVRQWQAESNDESTMRHRGAEGMIDALRHLAAFGTPGGVLHVKVKVTGISTDIDGFETSVLFEAAGHLEQHGWQQTATWTCRWKPPGPASDGRPKLDSILLTRYAQAEIRAPGGRLFVDCTKSVLGGNPSYERQVLTGINHWVPRIVDSGMSLFGYHGIAIGDANGDGIDDLYACDAGGLPNRLYLQANDGTARDASAAMGVDFLDSSRSALFIDLDNDGDQDLVIAMLRLVLFLENDANRGFRPRYRHAFDNARSMCAADFEGDGLLDVYVCAYEPQDDTGLLPTPVPYHDANNGGANVLLRNSGGFAFTDVTARAGLNVNNQRFSFAAAWEDYDRDGDMDLYVANDFGRNNLYRNDAGRFTDVAAPAGVEDTASGMSVSWGDVNRDGQADLYVGNMYSAAGNRVTYQPRFASQQSGPAALVASLQRMARGNTLYLATGDGTFSDVSDTAAVTMGRWAWSSLLTDWNNDGWLDVVVANGFITNEDTGDL